MLSKAVNNLKGFNMNRRKKRFFQLRISPLKLKLKCGSLEETEENSSTVQAGSLNSDVQPNLIEQHDVEGLGQTERKKKKSG